MEPFFVITSAAPGLGKTSRILARAAGLVVSGSHSELVRKCFFLLFFFSY